MNPPSYIFCFSHISFYVLYVFLCLWLHFTDKVHKRPMARFHQIIYFIHGLGRLYKNMYTVLWKSYKEIRMPSMRCMDGSEISMNFFKKYILDAQCLFV